jgi:hypothetical protein
MWVVALTTQEINVEKIGGDVIADLAGQEFCSQISMYSNRFQWGARGIRR